MFADVDLRRISCACERLKAVSQCRHVLTGFMEDLSSRFRGVL